jgi:hypothetical protein
MNTLKENSENINRVSNIVLDSLDENTCWTNCWNKDNPLLGHCRVVSAVIYAIFGGSIKWARINERTTHYWNVLPSGKELDLTKGQFTNSVIIPEGTKVTIDETLAGPTMKKTYPLLLKRVTKKLQK